MTFIHKGKNWLGAFIRILFVLFLLSSCIPDEMPSEVTPTPINQQVKNETFAQVTFDVDVPVINSSNPQIYIDLLDEVTGLALNPSRYKMEAKGTNHYSFQIPILVGSLIKYRYGRDGSPPLVEYSPEGKQVRYREAYITGAQFIHDTIAGWMDTPYKGTYGRLSGQVLDSHTNSPIPNILITIAGTQTLTGSNGNFLIEGIPTGIHNLVASSLEGEYEPFQQGAKISAGLNTSASIKMKPVSLVNVTFIANVPPDSVRGIPIRIVGNILTLGNTFADLGGGVSTVASRAPLMTLLPDGRYSLTLPLPVGMDLRYKYTAGDGFWNSEHTKRGDFITRQLIVPDTDITIEDTIESFQTKDIAPISFTVTVPENTPGNEVISIQFNPYGWTEPIPMWPLGKRQWLFVLYGPLHLVSTVGYRYCRNDQCGIADDYSTKGVDSLGKVFTPSRLPQNIQDEVKQWSNWQPAASATTVVADNIRAKGMSYIAGVELLAQYRPSWQPYLNNALDYIQQINANWVWFTPTWTATRNTPPVVEPVSGKDAHWQDLLQMMVWAQDKNLNIAVFPKIDFGSSVDAWWINAKRDSAWWQSWFDRYRFFLIHHADLASQIHAGYLIIGDPALGPSLPGGKLANGNSSDVPHDAEKRWSALISEVRSHYKGKVLWALPYSPGMNNVPAFAESIFDGYYLLWNKSSTKGGTVKTLELADEFGKILEQDVLKLKGVSEKIILLGVSFPSANGAIKGCIQNGSQCLTTESLETGNLPQNIQTNLSEQAQLYNAVLVAINNKSEIDGIVSRGFYPPAILHDASLSIYGKPAADILRYWFERMRVEGK